MPCNVIDRLILPIACNPSLTRAGAPAASPAGQFDFSGSTWQPGSSPPTHIHKGSCTRHGDDIWVLATNSAVFEGTNLASRVLRYSLTEDEWEQLDVEWEVGGG